MKVLRELGLPDAYTMRVTREDSGYYRILLLDEKDEVFSQMDVVGDDVDKSVLASYGMAFAFIADLFVDLAKEQS